MRREELLDLNEALQHPGLTLTFPISTELAEEEDLDLLVPITGELEAESTGNILLLHGDFHTRVVLECSRCCQPMEADLDFTMDDEFEVDGVPSSFARDGFAKVAASEEPYPIFKDNALIVDPYIRQGLILNMPFQPLCSSDCQPPTAEAAGEEHGHHALKGLQGLLDREEQAG